MRTRTHAHDICAHTHAHTQMDVRPKAEREAEGTVPSLNMTASLASNGKLNVDLGSKVSGALHVFVLF